MELSTNVHILLELLSVPRGDLLVKVLFLIALALSSRLRQDIIIDFQI